MKENQDPGLWINVSDPHTAFFVKFFGCSVPDPNPDPPDPRVFFGLPDPDPLVRGMDPDPALNPDPSIIMQNNKKNLESYYFVTLLIFIFEKQCKSAFQK
jgi:hypothetical protein